MTHKRNSTPVHPSADPLAHPCTPESSSPTTKKRGLARPFDHSSNMGRVQKALPHWRDHGDSSDKEHNYLRGAEWADREEREAYGRPLPAAYRYLLGPAPALSAGDATGARAYLSRIQAAIAVGGWTRSEWKRLHQLRHKWERRAEGQDARFKEVGNRRGGLNKRETAAVEVRKRIQAIKEKILAATRGGGD